MARTKINLDLRSLDRVMVLIHSDYGAGKTYFIGDMLQSELANGDVRFLNIRGEDGYLSLASMNLGARGETVETVDDYNAVLQEWRGLNLRALGLDSMKALCALVMKKEVGNRAPVKEEYGAIHFSMNQLTTQLRSVAPIVLCACPSDKSVNQITGRTLITPDLPGREATGSAGWFDIVGFMTAEVMGPGRVDRTISFAPSSSVTTRLRLPKPILKPVIISEGKGGWNTVWKTWQETLKPSDMENKGR